MTLKRYDLYFVMMVGLPGSGKSTKAIQYAEKYHAIIESSDSMREELFGDVNHQGDNDKVFSALNKRVKEDLAFGLSVIYDATNLSYKKRMAVLSEISKYNCHKICILMATPYGDCIERNENRDRVVPREVIDRMYKSFNVPYWYEGWDEIKLVYPDDINLIRADHFPVMTAKFDQQNHYHRQTLGMHCFLVSRQFPTYSVLYFSGLLHDCGKEYTKVFYDSKGNKTTEAHYYNHQYAGAYESLFYHTLSKNLEVAVRVMWHMQPYFWKDNPKLEQKYHDLWGSALYNDILELHEADELCH